MKKFSINVISIVRMNRHRRDIKRKMHSNENNVINSLGLNQVSIFAYNWNRKWFIVFRRKNQRFRFGRRKRLVFSSLVLFEHSSIMNVHFWNELKMFGKKIYTMFLHSFFTIQIKVTHGGEQDTMQSPEHWTKLRLKNQLKNVDIFKSTFSTFHQQFR